MIMMLIVGRVKVYGTLCVGVGFVYLVLMGGDLHKEKSGFSLHFQTKIAVLKNIPLFMRTLQG